MGLCRTWVGIMDRCDYKLSSKVERFVLPFVCTISLSGAACKRSVTLHQARHYGKKQLRCATLGEFTSATVVCNWSSILRVRMASSSASSLWSLMLAVALIASRQRSSITIWLLLVGPARAAAALWVNNYLNPVAYNSQAAQPSSV